MPHCTGDPGPPPLTVMPEIFNRVPITTEIEAEIEKACNLIRSDPGINLPLKDHIIKSILHMRGLPDPLHLARSIIGIHKASDSGSLQAFVEMFVAGIKFLRIADEHWPVYADEDEDDGDSVGSSSEGSSEDSEPIAERHTTLEGRNPARNGGPMCDVSGHSGQGAYLVDATVFPCTISDAVCCQITQQHLWDLLCCFWKPPVVNKIIDQCGEMDEFSEIKYFTNGILMSSACRQQFKRLNFYLLPLPETFSEKQYDVEFHWIHKPPRGAPPNYRPPLRITGTPDEHDIRFQPFKTGDRITFTTTDPIKHPLPDPGLLFARSLLAKISLPMEPHLIHSQRVRGYEHLDYFDSDTESDRDSNSAAITSMDDIGAWVDCVPVWDGRDPQY